MAFFQRPRRSYPFAANSTGRHRGSLNLGFTVGRVQVFEAIGVARAVFMDKLGPEVVAFLNDNGATVQESGSFVDLSLFMMGKSLLRTKPMLMFVSNDKETRLEAFNMVKRSAIMDAYPGFGLGHMDLRAEFENLQALAETKPRDKLATYSIHRMEKETSPETEYPDERHTWNSVSRSDRQSSTSSSLTGLHHTPGRLDHLSLADIKPHRSHEIVAHGSQQVYTHLGGGLETQRLLFDNHSGSTTETRAATAGGIVSHRGKYMLHTVSHFLERMDSAQAVPQPSAIQIDDTPECEVTGLSDFEDDDEDELADVTSRGSMTPESITCRGTPSQTDDGETASIFSSGGIADQAEFVASVNQRLVRLTLQDPQPSLPEERVQVGKVTVSSHTMDFALVELDSTFKSALSAEGQAALSRAVSLENYREHIEEAPRDAAIRTITPTGGTIAGTLSGAPSFIRLPMRKVFQEVYVGKLNRPLVPGDCGSWIRDAVTGKLYGHVIAGSPTTGLILVIPARHSFAEALASLTAPSDKPRACGEEKRPYNCPHCQRQFARQCDLTKHDKSHGRPYKCSEPNCDKATVGWRSAHELQRHVTDKHSPPAKDKGSGDLAETTHGFKDAKDQTATICQIDTVAALSAVVQPSATRQDVVHTEEWTSISRSDKKATPIDYQQPEHILSRIGSTEAIDRLRTSSLDIVRMNFSHGSYDYHQSIIDQASAANEADPYSVTPEYRDSDLFSGEVSDTVCFRPETSSDSENSLHGHIDRRPVGPFECVFSFAGCTSAFPSKAEWKRHTTEQHIQADWLTADPPYVPPVDTYPVHGLENLMGTGVNQDDFELSWPYDWLSFGDTQYYAQKIPWEEDSAGGTAQSISQSSPVPKRKTDLDGDQTVVAKRRRTQRDPTTVGSHIQVSHVTHCPYRLCGPSESERPELPFNRKDLFIKHLRSMSRAPNTTIPTGLTLSKRLLLSGQESRGSRTKHPTTSDVPSQSNAGNQFAMYTQTMPWTSRLTVPSTARWQAPEMLDENDKDHLLLDRQWTRHKCPHSGCSQQFNRAADLDRHKRLVHSADKMPSWICDFRPSPRNGTPFHRKDHFHDLLLDFHKEVTSMQRITSWLASADDPQVIANQDTINDDHDEGAEVIQADQLGSQRQRKNPLKRLLSLRDRDTAFVVIATSHHWQVVRQLTERLRQLTERLRQFTERLRSLYRLDDTLEIHFIGGDGKDESEPESHGDETDSEVESVVRVGGPEPIPRNEVPPGIYHPLKERQIRLISFSTSESTPQSISCQLTTHDLDQAPPYEALSYIWDPAFSRSPVSINGRTVHMSGSLAGALYQLAQQSDTTYYWIDAVCINSWNLSEKAQQTQLTQEIYRRALRVSCWINPWTISKSEEILEAIFGTGVCTQLNPTMNDSTSTFRSSTKAHDSVRFMSSEFNDTAWQHEPDSEADQDLELRSAGALFDEQASFASSYTSAIDL